MTDYILALDQGTTSSRAVLFDHDGRVCGIEQMEFPQHYPEPAWVEQAPEDIWSSQLGVATRLLRTNGTGARDIAAIGITNQRETTVIWERSSGRPVCNAIVWQDRRTAHRCHELRSDGCTEFVRSRTGLPIDPYFSATKIGWILDHLPGLRDRAERGELLFGTVDCFLVWRLTGGAVHATDLSNAARTQLFNIHTLDWDDALLELFKVPRAILPEVRPSSGDFGLTSSELFGGPIAITGVAGDQQAATFGQACHTPGSIKNTYGTGSFLLMNTGDRPRESRNGLLTTVGWQLSHSDHDLKSAERSGVTYALEGSIFVTGAAVQWLRDELQIIHTAAEIESLAGSVPDAGGIHFVPAFVGLGTPYWDSTARGLIIGLTRGSSRAHLARAALEAVCFQTTDVVQAMNSDSGITVGDLRVDGGMTTNRLLLQMQADILGIPVIKPAVTETTALGAAFLAGLAVGFWKDTAEIESLWRADTEYLPSLSEDERATRLLKWRRAVARAGEWAEE